MSSPSDVTDLRRADEPTLMQALAGGDPLALAEAYHRTIPAAHAVARRLVGGATEVEALLLSVYAELWTAPPSVGPLEGWVRRTTWAQGAAQLRADHSAPASPSAAGLLPDLPAPDVRFLDAAERAIAELADDERRALLLAHDKGVSTAVQESGAGPALTRALLALAGPESGGGDRSALDEDPCTDVDGIGDWCLGVLEPSAATAVAGAIEDRPGCGATSRSARRGRRRIEGLPATPDMGQRILVRVLTSTAGAVAPDPAGSDAVVERPGLGVPVAGDADAGGPEVIAVGAAAAAQAGLAEGARPIEDEAGDPFAPQSPPPASGDDVPAVDPTAEPGAGSPVLDTDDLPQAGARPVADDGPQAHDDARGDEDDSPTGSWMPVPGDSTAELRLSDILADDGDDDDPFADLDDDGLGFDDPTPAETPTGGGALDDTAAMPAVGDPYSALRGLESEADAGEPAPFAPRTDPTPVTSPVADPDDADVIGGYVEGQGDDREVAPAGRSALAKVLAWVLPVLGGGLLGIVIAIQVFGMPG